MDRKKILIVGDFGSIHLYNYAKNVLLAYDAEIHGFNIGGPINDIRKDFLDLYNQLGIRIQGGYRLKDGKVAYMRKAYKVLSQMGKFDICHLHFVSHYISPLVYLNRKKYSSIVLSFWGSDLYRSNSIIRALCRPLLKRCDSISFITQDMQDYFKLYIKDKSILSKCRILDFGNPFLKTIGMMKQTANVNKEELCSILHLNPDKLTVSVGYVWRREMRQYEALEQILPVMDKDSIQIAVPAYKIPQREKERIESLINQYGIEYRIYENFMGEKEVSALRVLSDIFIHPQTSDALSNAMLEHIYAGSVVLNGAWLNYEILEEHNVFYVKFNDMESLPSVLQKTLQYFPNEKRKADQNQHIVENFISWEHWAPQWLELYK